MLSQVIETLCLKWQGTCREVAGQMFSASQVNYSFVFSLSLSLPLSLDKNHPQKPSANVAGPTPEEQLLLSEEKKPNSRLMCTRAENSGSEAVVLHPDGNCRNKTQWIRNLHLS